MKKSIAKWIILVLLLGYVGYIGVWARSEADKHVCTGITVKVDGSRGLADSLAETSLRSELAKYPQKIVGARLNTINTLEIARYLSRFNNFESVDCILTPEGKLKVEAAAMIPEIRVFEPDGNSYYINKEGKRIDANAKFFVDVPIVQGKFGKSMKPTYVLPVVRYIQSDTRLKEIISSVKADDPENVLLIPKVSGHVINIGDTSRLVEKGQGIMTAYLSILPRMGWERYDTISVKFRNQIVCTRRHKLERRDYSEEEESDLEEATLEGLEEGTLITGTARSGDI